MTLEYLVGFFFPLEINVVGNSGQSGTSEQSESVCLHFWGSTGTLGQAMASGLRYGLGVAQMSVLSLLRLSPQGFQASEAW